VSENLIDTRDGPENSEEDAFGFGEIFKRAHDAVQAAQKRLQNTDYSEVNSRILKNKKKFEKRMREAAYIQVGELTHKMKNLSCPAVTLDPDTTDDDDEDEGDM
jgi:hypothetical protein